MSPADSPRPSGPNPLDGADALLLVLRAAEFAGRAHGTQTRKASNEPYINHPLRVAHQVAAAGLPAEAVAAALLHDVVEDTPCGQAEVEAAFPARVALLVKLLTQWWADDAPADVKQRERPVYYAALAEDVEAIAVKLLDRADNLHDMSRMLPRNRGWAARYLKKTEAELRPFVARCPNAHAREAFEQAMERLQAALAAHPEARSR